MLKRFAITAAVLLMLIPDSEGLLAQKLPAGDRRVPQPAGDLSLGEIQRLFDAYAVVQAQEMLKLNDSQYGQFVSRLKTLQAARRRGQQGRQVILQDLLRLSNQQKPEVAEGLIRDRLRALQEQEVRSADDIRKAYRAIDQLLDVRQQGRFRVFEDQMERRKFELLMRARQGDRPALRRSRPQNR